PTRSLRVLRCVRMTMTAARAHPLPKPLPLLRRHLLPPLEHPPARPPTPRRSSKSAEEDLAENQEAEGLPIGEHMPSRGRHHDSVPLHHDQPNDQGDGREDHGNEQHEFHSSIHSHFPNSS